MVADIAYLQQTQQQISELDELFQRQRAAFRANPMPSAEQRIQWLQSLRQVLRDEQQALIDAISRDFSNRSADETLLAEHGHILKPGERFRLALARALLRDPSILIVEEPSGPVDDDTFALLDDTMERASHGRTIVFLANPALSGFVTGTTIHVDGGNLAAGGWHRQPDGTYQP